MIDLILKEIKMPNTHSPQAEARRRATRLRNQQNQQNQTFRQVQATPTTMSAQKQGRSDMGNYSETILNQPTKFTPSGETIQLAELIAAVWRTL